METITQIRVAYALRKQGVRVERIAGEVGRHRATVYRWLKGIRQRGIEGYLGHVRRAKKGRRVRKSAAWQVQRVLSLRAAYRNCCGQKIVYLLEQEGIRLSVSTVYRILKAHLKLAKHTRTSKGQPAQRGEQAGEVIQVDTVMLGELYLFTAIDTCTREAAVLARASLTAKDGVAALDYFKARFGKVRVVQTDGGSEFEAEFAQQVHHFAQQHVIARPYKKNDQAFIECFNGTLRREEFGRTPFRASDLPLVQQRVDDFLHYYHQQRPHIALGMQTPAQFVTLSHLR